MTEEKIYIPTISEIEEHIVCMDCKREPYFYCFRRNHIKKKAPALPLFIPDLVIVRFGKWIEMSSEKLNRTFSTPASQFSKVVLGCGVRPGGHIPDQWWIRCNIGGRGSIKWLGSLDGRFKP